MAEGFRIATGYVEIKVDYDKKQVKKAAEAAGRNAGGSFGTSFNRGARKEIEDKFPWRQLENNTFKPKSAALGREAANSFARGFSTRANARLKKRSVDWDHLESSYKKRNKTIGERSGASLARGYIAVSNSRMKNHTKQMWKDILNASLFNAQTTGTLAGRSWSRSWNRAIGPAAVQTARTFATQFGRTHQSVGNRQAAKAGASYGRMFGSALAGALRPIIIDDLDAIKVFSVVTALMGAMGGSVGQLSSMTGLLAGAGSVIFSSIGRIIQFVGELSKAIGLLAALPGAVSALIASFGVLSMATANFRKALFGAGEEADEALAKIRERAPEAADAISGVRDAVSDLRDAAEDAFLKRIPKGLNAISDKLIPKMRKGVVSITNAWTDTINETLLFISSARGVSLVTRILESTAQQIRNGSDALPAFTEGFLVLSAAAMPALEDFATWINDITIGFRDWAIRSAAAGKVDEWIREGANALRTFSRLLGNIVGIMWSVFEVAGENGLMGRMEELTGRWNAFLKTAEGTSMLEDIFAAVNQQMEALAPVFKEIGKGILDLSPAIGDLTTAISPLAATVIRVFVDALKQITPGMVKVIEGLSETWKDLENSGAISRIAGSIGELFAILSPWLQVMGKAFIILMNTLSMVVDGVTAILGPVVAFVTRFETVRWIIAGVVAVLAVAFLPVAAGVKAAILGIAAVAVLFSDKMDAVRPYVLGVAAVITTFLAPALVYASGAFIATRVAAVKSWVTMAVTATVRGAQTVGTLILVAAEYWKTALASTRSFAVQIANYAWASAAILQHKVRVTATNIALRLQFLYTTIAARTYGMSIQTIFAMAAVEAVKGTGRMIASLARTGLAWTKAALSSTKAALVMAANWVIAMGPVAWAIAAVIGIVAAFVLLWKKSEAFRDFFIGMWNTIKDTASKAWEDIKGAVDIDGIKGSLVDLKTSMMDAWTSIKEAVAPIMEWFSATWEKHGDKVVGVVKVIGAIVGGVLGVALINIFHAIIGVFKVLIGVVVGVVTMITNIIQGAIKVISGIFKVISGIFSGDMEKIKEGVGQIWGGLLQILSAPFLGFWEFLKGLWDGVSAYLGGVFNTLDSVLGGKLRKMVSSIIGWFKNLWDGIKSFVQPMIDWVVGIFDWLYVVLVGNSIVPDMVRAIVQWFANMGTWLLEQATKAKDWVIAKFNELWQMAQAIWNGLTSGIRALFQAYVNWITTTVVNFVKRFIDRFNNMRDRVQAVWNALKNFVVALLNAHVKWVVSKITNLVTKVVNGFNNMRDRARAAWNNLKNFVIQGALDLYKRATDALNRFKDGAIRAFERAKDGIKSKWKQVEDVAKAPVRFVINTVYNNGIVELWNKVAKKVPGLSELSSMSMPRGFASGGILPGDSNFRQGDDQLVPMRKGEGVYVSEAMRDPYERARLHAVNKAAMQGKSLGKFRDGGFPTAAGVFPGEYTGQKKLNRRTSDRVPEGIGEGFTRGGILGALGTAWDNIQGGIKSWATKPLNSLKSQFSDRFSTGDNFEGVPYKMTTSWIDKILDKFGKEDDSFEGGANGGVGQAKDVISKASSFVGKTPGRPNQFSRAMGMPYGPWCAAFVSEIFRMVGATGSIRGITARNGGAAVRTFNGRLRKVPHSARKAGDLPTYRGSGHINILANRNSTIGGNESDRVRRQNGYVNSATAILRPGYKTPGAAEGGIIGATPRGAGSHDIGGMLPDRHVAHNRSGEAEVIQTLDHLKAIVSAMEKGGDTYNINTVQINPDSIEQIQSVCDLFKTMKKSARANGGNVRYRIRD